MVMSRQGVRYDPIPGPACLRLICFPYAGGSPLMFRSWCRFLPVSVELCSVELPGRGALYHEPPIGSLDEAVATVYEALAPYLDGDFALYGHSLGALLAFELARELRRKAGASPWSLLVSAIEAPHTAIWTRRRQPLHKLGDEALTAELRRFGGTPREVLESRELMELIIPTLRADFKQIETYRHRAETPLELPIVAFAGRNDELVRMADLLRWREQTGRSFALRLLPGDHFGMLEGPAGLPAEVGRRLETRLRARMQVGAVSSEEASLGYSS
jgi:medium-chain acyl-[acyl-carrier-protein] hydrolase